MERLTEVILAVMEQAAISGLCRQGQLEIGVQQARKVLPDLSDEELVELVNELYDVS